MSNSQPGLFGLSKTNRDFTQKKAWGKNQFNSSFPASLCCYLASKDEEAVYLSIQNGEFQQATISVRDLFNLSPTDSDLYFAFEFVWSNAGFSYFISEIANCDPQATKITRQTRTVIWLFKMLADIAEFGRFDHARIIDQLSYNTKNDKAFATAGNTTNGYMSCERLEKPKIKKSEIQNIILGGGQNLLSPERRFDAIIFNSPELFQKKN